MTGVEHSRQAEKHVAWAHQQMTDVEGSERAIREHLAYAQVHATLALVDQVGVLVDAIRADRS